MSSTSSQTSRLTKIENRAALAHRGNGADLHFNNGFTHIPNLQFSQMEATKFFKVQVYVAHWNVTL